MFETLRVFFIVFSQERNVCIKRGSSQELAQTQHHSFPLEGLFLSPGDVLYKLQLEWEQSNLFTAAFSSLLLLRCLLPTWSCGKHSWLVIALVILSAPKNSSRCPTPFHVQLPVIVLKCKHFSKHNQSTKMYPKKNPGSLQLCMMLLKRHLFRPDPLFVFGCMVGRKPLSHFHRGLLCTLEQTIISSRV